MPKKQKPLPWIKLDNENHPPINLVVLIYVEAGKDSGPVLASLQEKKTNVKGTEFLFTVSGLNDTYTNPTHYMTITAPE